MGYYIFSYGIETDKIKSVFNSGDENALEAIRKTGEFETYKDFLPKGANTTPSKAIEDIVKGKPYDNEAGFAYGYALICIAGALGKKPPYFNDIKLGYETDLINRYISEDFGVTDFDVVASLFADEQIPFDIPPPKDWPSMNLLTQNELIKLDEKLKHIQISFEAIERLNDADEEDKGCAYEHIKGLRENIRYCVENSLEMIVFCH